jgi:hypothetical protein
MFLHTSVVLNTLAAKVQQQQEYGFNTFAAKVHLIVTTTTSITHNLSAIKGVKNYTCRFPSLLRSFQ